MFDNLSLRAKILMGSAVSLGFLILLSLLSLSSISKLNETGAWVDHTYKVINKAQELETAALEMQTGIRGYLLAGTEQYLVPYEKGRQHFKRLVAELLQTVDDNPSQVALMQEMDATMNSWEEYINAEAVALRREIGDAKTMNDMARLVAEAKGKTYFDRFRGMLANFINQEQILLRRRKADFINASTPEEVNAAIEWVEHTYQVIAEAQKIQVAAIDMETGMRGYLLAGREEFLEPYNGGVQESVSLISLLKLKVSDNPAQVQLLTDIARVLSDWNTLVAEPQITLRREIGDAKTMDDMADLIGSDSEKLYFDKFSSQIRTFIENENILLKQRQQNAYTSSEQTNYILIIGMSVAALISIPAAFLISASIHKPFRNIFQGLSKFSSSELKELSRTFKEVVTQLKSGAAGVGTVASNIENASMNLSQISNRQASSVEETSASTEEISGMVKINVQSAEQSRDLSRQVGEKMGELQLAMEQIAESNEKINELVKIIGEIGTKTEIIDEIVFQTKLLSFNASVEAERAGEHGRGFGVVAKEVGNLAQMSGKAATDIAAIVKHSVSEAEAIAKENSVRVERGNQIVKETKSQAQTVVTGANKIFEASNEQARGIQEISNAVESINKATQHAASISDQAAASSTDLRRQSEELNRLVLRLNSFLRNSDRDSTPDSALRSALEPVPMDSHWQAPASRPREDVAAPIIVPVSQDSDNKQAWDRL
ncbi:CHASE3 domain-containing protein [Shewanella corallii]|uniref:CHASE3 domain-containing protein n=1 Tax=Shewanella corallii TaxID=560080 RepID=A0ABT0NAA5_9GAMM|nr:CHASE3 domain-containing protein [Shewanella corallii]MCL2915386.1 CHASE3 domain-containing protein [Shewanella corallii]